MATRKIHGDAPGGTTGTFRLLRAGLSALLFTTQVTVSPPDTTNFGSDFAPVAARPGARLTALKAAVSAIPDWSSVPAMRRFVVSANTEAAFLEAYNAACAMQNAGSRLVIVPDGYSIPIALNHTNASPATDIIVVPQRVVDGTYVLARGLRPNLESSTPWTAPSWAPRFYTKQFSGGGHMPLVTFSPGANARGLRFYACDLRINGNSAGDSFCYELIDFGGNSVNASVDPAMAPQNLCLSHCWVGGHKFDQAGNWRSANLGRVVYDGGQGCALLDFWVGEHGTSGGQGSDRGIWGGVFSQGKTWIMNYGTDGSSGGIAFIHGGGDVPDSFPNCDDMEVALCHSRWTDDYVFVGGENGTGRNYSTLLDASGNGCPWQRKNLGEIKAGRRHWYHHNVFDGFTLGVGGQNAAVTIKSVQQDGNGRRYGTEDITFSHNVVRSKRGGCLYVINAQSPSGVDASTYQKVNGIKRLTIYGNHCSGTGEAENNVALVSFATNPDLTADPAQDWQFVRNLVANTPGGQMATSALRSAWSPGAGAVAGILEVWGNVDTTDNVSYPITALNYALGGGSTFGFQHMFGHNGDDTGGAPLPPNLTFRDWHTLTQNDGGTAGDFSGAVHRYANLAALGLARDSSSTLYAQTAPTLNTAGASASSVGPAWALLNAVVSAVTSGDVRAFSQFFT